MENAKHKIYGICIVFDSFLVRMKFNQRQQPQQQQKAHCTQYMDEWIQNN